jgi:hypothetical protein
MMLDGSCDRRRPAYLPDPIPRTHLRTAPAFGGGGRNPLYGGLPFALPVTFTRCLERAIEAPCAPNRLLP